MADMVIARYPEVCARLTRISAALEHASITHEMRPYTVDQPGHRAHGAAYTMIVVPSGKGSRAVEAWDIARRTY